MSRPRPVLTANTVAGVVTTLAFVLGFLGMADKAQALSGEAQAIGGVVVGAVAIGGHLLAALHAQSKVTPIVSPLSADGTPLVAEVTAQVAPPLVQGVAAPKHAADVEDGPLEVESVDIPAEPVPLTDYALPPAPEPPAA